MADIAQQIKQARDAGYSDAEISDFVSRNNTVLAPKIKAATAAGYQPSEILGHLSGMPKPAAKPYDTRSRGAKMKGETDPNALGNGFMGTLASDVAGAPEGIFNLIRHPVDSAVAIGKSALSLPGDLYTDVSEGNWGKLAARTLELGMGARTGTARTVGTVAKDAVEGATDALKRAPASRTGQAIGAVVGGKVGHAAGWEGAVAGAGAGAAVGGKLPAMGDAIQAGINRVKLRAQQRNNPAPTGETFGPPRVPPVVGGHPSPAWQSMPERTPGWNESLDVSPVPAWELPSGRVPGMPQLPRGADIPRSRPAPAWQSMPDRTPGWDNPVEVAPVPAKKLPSGRTPGKPIKSESVSAAGELPSTWTDPATGEVYVRGAGGNWKGGKPSTPSVEPPSPPARKPPFTGNAEVRETTARNISLAKAMHQGQMTPEMAQLMEGPHWKQLAEGMGLKVPNAESVKAIVAELQRLYGDTPAVASNPKAYAQAVALRDEAQSSGTIPKPSPRGRIKPPSK